MSSELNRENTRENGGPIHFTSSPAKIDPMTAAAAEQEVAVNMTNGGRAGEEKQDMPKPDEPLAGVLGGSDRSLGQNMMQSTPPASEANPHHYYRDVYSSSPEDENDLNNLNEEAEDVFIQIDISEAHKVGEGISSFMAYKVDTRTNMKLFRRQSFSVTRRFSDFLGLHEKIAEKHGPRGRIIPPAPEKSLVGTTRVKIASNSFDGGGGNGSGGGAGSLEEVTTEHRTSEKEFIARRRFALERFVNRVAQHPILRKDTNFVEFLESNRDLPRATSTSALSSASVFRFIGKMGDTVTKITYKMEETDPWYEDKIVQLEALEAQLKKLYTLAEAVAATRRELALATGSFAAATSALATTEDSNNLSKALSNLAIVEEKVEKVQHRQADADHLHLFELFKDYVGLMGAVRDALTERQKAFQAWQHAQSMVLKKKEQRARLEMGNKLDKIPAANEEVQEWETKLDEGQANFVKVSDVVKAEIDFFERYRVKDFKSSIIKYMEELMECQTQMVHYWEDFLPEVKNSL